MRRATQMLHEIAVIRDLQRQHAEVAAARAARDCQRAEKECAACERARDETEESWRSGLLAQSLPLDLMRLWSTQLLRQEQEVTDAEQSVTRAREHRDGRRANWATAVNLSEHAERAASEAFLNELEERDVRALQDVLDRHAVKSWGAP